MSLAIFSLKGITEAVDVISGIVGKRIEPNHGELVPETMPKLEVTRVEEKYVEVRGSGYKLVKKWLLGKKFLGGDEQEDYVTLTPDPDGDEPGIDNNFYVNMLEDLADKKGFDYTLTVLEAACVCARPATPSARVPRMNPRHFRETAGRIKEKEARDANRKEAKGIAKHEWILEEYEKWEAERDAMNDYDTRDLSPVAVWI